MPPGGHRCRGDALPDGVSSITRRSLPRRTGGPPHVQAPARLQAFVLPCPLPSMTVALEVKEGGQGRPDTRRRSPSFRRSPRSVLLP